MIAGLNGRGRDVAGQEQEAGNPEQAMHERRNAFVEANSPLCPSSDALRQVVRLS
jgi:hypothetical protein